MRILMVSNFYPPAGNGGYEQWCQEVSCGLVQRGHQVVVLTSRMSQPGEPWVYPVLYLEMEFASLTNGLNFFTRRRSRELANLAMLDSHAASFQPQVVLLWGMWNLPRSLPALAEALYPSATIYYLGDYWPTLPSQHAHYWEKPAQTWSTRVPKALLRPLARAILARQEAPALRFPHALFPSQFMLEEYRRQGVDFGQARVVHGAIDTRPFLNGLASIPAQNGKTTRLLYVGRFAPEKGIPTALEAVASLAQQHPDMPLTLTLAGSGESSYTAHLQNLVAKLGLEQRVTFEGSRSKEQMPALYRQFDLFLFTSTWQEPFGRVLVEAMASGLPVIGTATGGAAEILVDGVTGLTYSPGDAGELATQIIRLTSQPDLRRQLAENARKAAVGQFDISRMVAEIEAYLQGVAGTEPTWA